MIYLNETVENEIVIERSKFITILTPINSLDEMSEILKQIKKQYPKATHYCTAYVFKDTQGSNDDGEPSGTAGAPILEMLNQFQVKNVFAVVVRYFGGIKLGAGGLIRAYAKSAKEALKLGKYSILKKAHLYQVKFTYDKIHDIDTFFNDYIIQKEFLEDVIYDLRFFDDESMLDKYRYLFKDIKENGTKEILVPWENINHID